MGKTRINDNGYLEFVNSGNLVHIWKARKKYDVDKLKGMHVHHIDGDKRNNNHSNIILLSSEDHYDLHQYENKEYFTLTYNLLYFFFLKSSNFWLGLND